MLKGNPRFETYFAKPRPWQAEINALRQILLECQLSEELKWRQPCYTYNGSNIVILSSFKAFCALSFFKGSLLADPTSRLVQPGPNSQAARMLRFTSVKDIEADRALIKDFVNAAIAIETAGQKVDFTNNRVVEISPELAAALAENSALKTAWDTLSPGRRRSWVLHFDSAKQSSTKTARIKKASAAIIRGLGQHEDSKLRSKSRSEI